MADAELFTRSAAELGRLCQSREVSSVELAALFLDRLEAQGRSLNAVAELTRDLALALAAEADREIASGQIRGPLHGVPYGAKDLLATRGIPTRWGSPTHQDQVFDYDAVVVERLRAAGAVLVGKLAMVELAGGGGYDMPGASLTGPCRNPWDPTRWAGGSSSGSGAAVGGALVPFALGSETWGSITVPSAFCNVSGLRPTYGRVPRHGAMALCWTLDKIGPMARTAEDCGLALAAIAGHDPRDPSSAQGRFAFDPGMLEGSAPRLGILHHDDAANDAPEAERLFGDALAVFRALGCTASDTALPDFPYNVATSTLVTVEGAASFENLIRSPDLDLLVDPAQRAGLLAGLAVPAVDYLWAMRVRSMAAPAAVHVFEHVDALVAPTLLQVAPPANASIEENMQGAGGNGGPGNLLGWPSISIPMGFGRDNLPLGLELIGPPYAENTLLALAMAYQRETDWHRRLPATA